MEDRGKRVGRGKRGFKSVSRIAYVSWDTEDAPRVLSTSSCRWWGCPSCLPFHISPAKGIRLFWMDDMGDNVRECGRGTSGEFALPLPFASLEREGNNDQSDWGSAVGNGVTTPAHRRGARP